jgi:hypothetical protein
MMKTTTIGEYPVAAGRPMSLPGLMLRIEGVAVLAAAVLLYGRQDFSWVWFALLLLAPDLAIIPYAINQRFGRIVYNVAHTYTLPLVLALIGLMVSSGVALQMALIWFAHIGMDRMVGYGLKYPDSFKETHLQRV